MRQLKRGFTIIEVLIGLAIMAMLVGVGVPYFGDYMVNARLREGGHAVYAETLLAQSEAIKRNATTRLIASGSTLELRDMAAGGAGAVLRQSALPETLQFVAAVNMDFGSDGRPTPFGTNFAVNLGATGVTCSDSHRCPGLRVDAGGAVRLCADRLASCP
jgi:type IV fimbrial biogenesis protein FimT